MTQPAPPMISVLREQGHCVGAEPRGFQAYGAAGQPLGLFQDKQAAIEAITAANLVVDGAARVPNGRLQRCMSY